MRDSFLMYSDSYNAIKKLSNEQAGELLHAIFKYQIDGEIQDMSQVVSIVFEFFKNHFDRDAEKWGKEIEKRREAGRLGGLAKASSAKQILANVASAKSARKILANVADSVNVNVNVSDSVNENVNNNNINNTTAHAVAKATTPQADFVNQFSKIYNAKTGQMFKAGKEDYILIANMLKQFGLEVVASKLRTLSELCENQSVWFTKDGFSSFTIKKLSQFWNEIIPKESEAEKSDRIVREMVAERMRERNERA